MIATLEGAKDNKRSHFVQITIASVLSTKTNRSLRIGLLDASLAVGKWYLLWEFGPNQPERVSLRFYRGNDITVRQRVAVMTETTLKTLPIQVGMARQIPRIEQRDSE